MPASWRAERPWRNDGVTMTCGVCGRTFVPSGRRRFCSDACRQTAWRRRQPALLPVLPTRAPRPATVYECPSCENRWSLTHR